jgi:hypothetical protein
MPQGLRTRVDVKNCQTWLRDVVVVLVENGIFPDDALVTLDRAPKKLRLKMEVVVQMFLCQ